MNGAPDPGLELNNVEISLKGQRLLNVSHHVRPGETLTVMGPSGSGKSSLLAFIGGYLDPAFEATGEIRLNGRCLLSVPVDRRHVGVLFQDALLFPHMSVAGNLMFAIEGSARQRRALAETALAEIGLEGFGDRDPETLSGGQRARVALMRALVSRPDALLLDEPFSKLDVPLRRQMRDLVFARAKERCLPVVLVTHDREDAEAAGGAVIEIGGWTTESR